MKHLVCVCYALATVLSLSGCTIKTDYQKPEVRLSEKWIGQSLSASKTDGIDPSQLHWTDFLRDEQLQQLITLALQFNHDLKTAALNIELAEAQHGISRTNLFPTVAATGGFNRNRASNSFISEQYRVGFGISNFELDFFGRIKNQNTAALNQYLATKEARDSAQLSLISAVAKTYYQWRINEELLTLAKRTLDTREKSYQLIKQRFNSGIAAGTDISTAQSAIENANVAHQRQLRMVQQTKNALSTLIGQPLSSFNLSAGKSLIEQFPQKEIFADIPATVLFYRPDIRQAEYALIAAHANIAAARAAMYPSINLTTSIGLASQSLGTLFDGGNYNWAIAPGINLPIFDYNRRKTNIKTNEINEKILVENYQKTVQNAFRDVNDALIARETLSLQYQAEKRAQSATTETLRLIKSQVEVGLSDGLRLLDAERADFAIRQRLLATQLLVLNNQINLFTALGGGIHHNKSTYTKKAHPHQ